MPILLDAIPFRSKQLSFSPLDIPDLELWLPADQIMGLIDNDPVATWPDQSGNGRDVSQGTAAKRPLYKTNIQNGRPVVRFDGIDDDMIRAAVSISQPNTIYLVARSNDSGAGNFFDGIGSRQILRPNGLMFAGVGFTATFTATNWNVYAMRFNGASSVLNVNNGSDQSGDAGANAIGMIVLSGQSTGVAEFISGDIAEVLVYSGLHSNQQRSQVQSYLGSKWGVVLS